MQEGDRETATIVLGPGQLDLFGISWESSSERGCLGCDISIYEGLSDRV